jgi:hypothetical protein
MKKTALFLHFGAKISKEHEYNCSRTSQKNTITNKTVDMSSAFEHLTIKM